ncbi:hypothetical protein XELAEV_18009836mg [Xenopus laevis]|uniref:DNA-binding protein RFX2 n=1 Tax=Xenopus laevis TaxID=8355 RepID=A0A974I1E3_XENLA|nr:hypothetical protein XELAEV_18009836mg [Xenopus laevis]
MQNSDSGSDSATSVALRTSTSAQAPVVQPVPASQQVQTVQHVYPAQVQYVEGDTVYTNGAIRTAYSYNAETQIYAPSSGSSYFDSQGGGAQVTTVVSSPTAIPSHSMVGITMDVSGSQIISSSGAYLIHGGLENSRHTPSHTSRTFPATLEMAIENLQKNEGITSHKSSLLNSHLQWLLDNYETAEGVSLPRSSLYNHYLRHCQDHKLDPVNAASFGKLIRSVFMGLRTRRLDTSHVFPDFPAPDLGSLLLPEGITMTDIKNLQLMYRRHCEATIDVVMNLQFQYIEKLWQAFWNSKPSSPDGSNPMSSEDEQEPIIPNEKLMVLCKYEPIMRWMRNCDHILYQALVEILIPDVLRPVPSTLTQAIRNFAKSLEGWLTNAMCDFPQQIVHAKVGVVSAFAQTLRRYTSLNHLAQAARAVLQNTSQINQMLSDLNRVDFANVQEQASWVCQCDEGMVQKLEQDFKLTLQQQSSLDQWANWLDNVVTQVLKPHEGSPSFPKAARQFLLKWSFYSSMVIRDLTLRSAASFGSFHLIRLLYDEYMFYLVEHRVAQATGETPIAVMGEFSDFASMSPVQMDKDDVSELGSDTEGDPHISGQPPVKRERVELNHSMQEM